MSSCDIIKKTTKNSAKNFLPTPPPSPVNYTCVRREIISPLDVKFCVVGDIFSSSYFSRGFGRRELKTSPRIYYRFFFLSILRHDEKLCVCARALALGRVVYDPTTHLPQVY